jgi:hypothetical protein
MYLKPPPIPLIDATVIQKAMLKVVYGTLQFKEQEMAAEKQRKK